MSEPYTGPPDIAKDKLLVIAGAVLFSVTEPVVFVDPAAPTWVTAIPDKTSKREHDYPRDRRFRILHEVQVGTVSELVKLYEQRLTAAYNTFVIKQPDGEPPVVIPSTGEASLGMQNKILCEQFGPAADGHSVVAKAQPDEYEAFHAPKYEKYGEPKPRQPMMERDVLMRLVATYRGRRFPADGEGLEGKEKLSYLLDGPTDTPKAVQALIDALTILKEDAEARYAHQKARAEAAGKTPLTEAEFDATKN